MKTPPYDDILQRAKAELTAEEQARLAAELAAAANGRKHRSILELEGLGKEVWGEINPDEYVAQERDSWDD